jgi:phosphoglucomutase
LKKESTDEIFVIGGEESYGLLKGTYARDKDGAAGALPLAEYAAELKQDGKTLYDRLLELYNQHGLYVERLNTMVCPGASGFEQMQRIMTSLRESAPTDIEGHTVTALMDYASLQRQDLKTGETTPIDCQSGNVIVLEFGDSRRRITIRPSGTEPKLKFYIQWYAATEQGSPIRDQYEHIERQLEGMAKELEGILLKR